jgi:hypothetical protein
MKPATPTVVPGFAYLEVCELACAPSRAPGDSGSPARGRRSGSLELSMPWSHCCNVPRCRAGRPPPPHPWVAGAGSPTPA